MCKVFDRIGMFGKLTYHFPVLQVLLFGAALLLVIALIVHKMHRKRKARKAAAEVAEEESADAS